MAKAKTVAGYVKGLEPWQAEIVEALRALVKKAAPKSNEVIKWSQPVFEDGGPFAYTKAFNKHVNFGFWRGAELDDEKEILEGGETMRHVKLSSVTDIKKGALTKLIKQAVKLNREKGNPTSTRK